MYIVNLTRHHRHLSQVRRRRHGERAIEEWWRYLREAWRRRRSYQRARTRLVLCSLRAWGEVALAQRRQKVMVCRLQAANICRHHCRLLVAAWEGMGNWVFGQLALRRHIDLQLARRLRRRTTWWHTHSQIRKRYTRLASVVILHGQCQRARVACVSSMRAWSCLTDWAQREKRLREHRWRRNCHHVLLAWHGTAGLIWPPGQVTKPCLTPSRVVRAANGSEDGPIGRKTVEHSAVRFAREFVRRCLVLLLHSWRVTCSRTRKVRYKMIVRHEHLQRTALHRLALFTSSSLRASNVSFRRHMQIQAAFCWDAFIFWRMSIADRRKQRARAQLSLSLGLLITPPTPLRIVSSGHAAVAGVVARRGRTCFCSWRDRSIRHVTIQSWQYALRRARARSVSLGLISNRGDARGLRVFICIWTGHWLTWRTRAIRMRKYGGKGKESVAGVVVPDTENAERRGGGCEGEKDEGEGAGWALGAEGGVVYQEGGCRSTLWGGFRGRVSRSCVVMHGQRLVRRLIFGWSLLLQLARRRRIVERKHALFLLHRAITTLAQRRQWGVWIGRAQRRYASAAVLNTLRFWRCWCEARRRRNRQSLLLCSRHKWQQGIRAFVRGVTVRQNAMIRDLVVARYLRSSMVAKARMDIQEWSRNAAVAVLCRHAALLSAHYRLSERKLMSLGVESLHESVLSARRCNHKAAKLLVARLKKVQASTIFQWAASMLEMRSASLIRFQPRSEARIDTLIAGFDSD